MKYVQEVLQKLETLIKNDEYQELETEAVEIKNMPAKLKSEEYSSIKESICAFLNTNDGFIIVGIKENIAKKRYYFKGYKSDFEPNIKLLETNSVKDFEGNQVDVSAYIHFEIVAFLDGNLLIIHVEKLPYDKKYVFFNDKAYERKLTGDHIIHQNKILEYQEYKKELQYAKELHPVINTTIQNLSVDKLNDYIYWINKEYKIESAKADIESAKSFLLRKNFITKDGDATYLGMLVCGKHLDDYIGNRCEVDCYLNSPIKVAQSKKIIKDTILQLLDESFRFVYRNIQVGISAENGGTSIAEYPENLIRECINNSLAHRDYTINKPIFIEIVPQKHIEIRNPGSFKKALLLEEGQDEIPLRRIVPNQKAVNPKLADILKVFNKYEGKGIGMATLVNECMEDKIDLPYYKFNSENDISLVIRSGKLLDNNVEYLLVFFSGFIDNLMQGKELTDDQKHVIAYLYKSELENDNYRYTILLTSDNNHLDAIKSLEKAEIIYKHQKSTETHPTFILNRELMKTNFNSELIAIFGNAYTHLSYKHKECLNIVYKVNTYKKEKLISVTEIEEFLYIEKSRFQNISNLNEISTFLKKINGIIRELEQQKFLKKVNEKYIVNTEYLH